MARPIVPLAQAVPIKSLARDRYLYDAGRLMGLLVLATRGTGKSTLLGRIVALQDFLRGVPLVILDPLGGTIDYFLDSLIKLPPEYHQAIFSRIRYVNMAGQDGKVVPWPIYAKMHPTELPDVVSDRYVAVLQRFQPKLIEATVQGGPRVFPLATVAGIILSGLDLGITEVPHLIKHPRAWESRLREVLARYPDTIEAVTRMREHAVLAETNVGKFDDRTEVLLNHLSLFQYFPNFRAIFGATTPGIDWAEVVAKRQAVLLDFRDITSPEKKKFCLLWLFNSLLTYIRSRGHGHEHVPLSWMIDELSYLVAGSGMDGDLVARDLNELINRLMRSHGVWLTLASQELFQFSQPIQKYLLSMGNVVLGRTSDRTAAKILADKYYEYEPYKVKKVNRVWMNITDDSHPFMRSVSRPGVIDYTTEEFTMEEQVNLNSRIFLKLAKFHFLYGMSQEEGMLASDLEEISLAPLIQGQRVVEARVSEARSLLMQRDGQEQAALLREIAGRLPEQLSLKAASQPETRALEPPAQPATPTRATPRRLTPQQNVQEADKPQQLVLTELAEQLNAAAQTKQQPLRRKPQRASSRGTQG